MVLETTSSLPLFETTRWSMVLAAGAEDGGSQARGALEDLCRLYWTPAYVYVRRRGLSRPDAQDLTQAFFVQLVAGGALGALRPGAGRFRTYLLRCLENFLRDDRRRRLSRRRGGGVPSVPLDAVDEVEREMLSPVVPPAPDAAFDRRWAEVIVAQATAVVRREHPGRRGEELFDLLQPLLFGTGEDKSLARTGEALAMTPAAVRNALTRLRTRFRTALRREVARTLVNPAEELEDELRHLIDSLAQVS